MDHVELTFDDDALDYIVDKAIEFKLGARGLRGLTETIMMDFMFEIPHAPKKHEANENQESSPCPTQKLIITRAIAEAKLSKIDRMRLSASV